MASETVEILIEADDKASAKFEKVGQSAEKQVKAFKEVGAKAKASTELVGTLAGALGNTGISSFAGQLAQLTERVSAFSEVAKAGGSGAFAFKAGLVGAAGVLSFQVGKALGDIIFQTEKWNQALEESVALSRDLNAEFSSRRSEFYRDELEAVREIADSEERRIVAQEKINSLAQDLAGKERLAADLRKELEERYDGYFDAWKDYYGEFREHSNILRRSLADAEGFVKAGQKYKQELLEIVIADKEQEQSADKFIESLREQLDLLKATKEERYKIEAAKNTTNTDEAVRLMKERDAILAKQDAEKQLADQRRKAVEVQAAENKRLADSRQGIIERLREEATALRFGQQAADAYAFKLQGFDDQTANTLASLKDQIRKSGESGGSSTANSEEISATQGRLLTRGGGNNQMLQASQETAVASKQSTVLLDQVLAVLQQLRQKEPVQITRASA